MTGIDVFALLLGLTLLFLVIFAGIGFFARRKGLAGSSSGGTEGKSVEY